VAAVAAGEVLREQEGVVGIMTARGAMRGEVAVVEMEEGIIRVITNRRTPMGRTRDMWVRMVDRVEVATAAATTRTIAVARAADRVRVRVRVKEARITATAKTKRRSERGERPRSAG